MKELYRKIRTKIMPKQTMILPEDNKTMIMPENEMEESVNDVEEVQQQSTYIHVGTILNDTYTLIDVIAENTGEAALFVCEADRQKFVAKVYHQNKKPKQEIIERIREIQSPHIIPIIDHGEFSNRYYTILPYYQKGDLLKMAPLELHAIVDVVVPAVNEGLHTLHNYGIVHRDIKPDNIFITDDEEGVVIGDFGISSRMEERITVRKTSASRTLGYSAPEATQGYVSKESDYYSFGITLLYLATGFDPFSGMTDEQIIKMTITDKLHIPENTDQHLAHLIKGLTVKERKDRWGYEEVQRWSKGEFITINESAKGFTHHQPYHFKDQEFYNLEGLALALAQSWDEGIKHLKRGFISAYIKPVRQDLASEIMDYEEERDNDTALFKTIYSLSPDAPLCWKGEVFQELSQLGEAMKKQMPDLNEYYAELLQKGMLLFFLQKRQASAELIKEVESLQSLAGTDPSKAYYKLYYLLSNSTEFQLEEDVFQSVDELVEYLYEHRQRVEEIAKGLLEQPYFFAWLEKLGYEEFIKEWKKIQYD
ncbi:serine/threonine protein kinase [Niallia endozanthoxylica]|nr:serine/threonine-protein kinase [Niallia endozanthoxylica]